jgi:hypothetical protein
MVARNVKNMKCTGLKAVSYPDAQHLIKVVPLKHALTPVYFIFSVRHSNFLLWDFLNVQNVNV